MIQGRYLQRGVRMSDYRVVIGNGTCNVLFLSDSLLVCRPPYDEPELSSDDPFCGGFNSILVRYISAGYYLRHGGYVIVIACLSVCLSVSNFAQKLTNGFA